MKKNLIILASVAILIMAAKPIGELVGTSKKRSLLSKGFVEANPYGMVFIKRGSFIMGPKYIS